MELGGIVRRRTANQAAENMEPTNEDRPQDAGKESQNLDDDEADDVVIGEQDTDDDEEYEQKDDLMRIWEKDVRDALDLEQSIRNQKIDTKEAKNKRKDFAEQRRHNWTKGKTIPAGHNFLHFLASSDQVKSKKLLIYLVAQVVPICPEQIGEVCGDPQAQVTPLTMAISTNNDNFISAICQLKKQKEVIRRHLSHEADEAAGFQGLTTCLHAAIARGVKVETYPKRGGLSFDHFKDILELSPPQSFSVTNSRGLTPLHMAIGSSKEVADEVISLAPEVAFLSKDSTKGWTPLHTAVVGTYPDRLAIIQRLAERCPEALVRQDQMGRTPLHLAVEYDSCTKDQLSIVNLLISSGPGALKMHLSTLQKLSPFQHHEHTRQQSREKAQAVAKERVRLTAATQKNSVLRVKNEADNNAPGRSGSKTTEKTSNKDHDNTKVSMPNSAVRRASIGSASQAGIHRVVAAPASPVELPSHAKAFAEPTGATNEIWADQIRDRLKLEYLRTMKPQESLKFLGATSVSKSLESEKLLWFDFGPKPLKKMTKESLVTQFGHLRFDNVLKYVAVPKLDLGKHNEAKLPPREGRVDLQPFFRWLREKEVKHIVRLEIDDMELSHTDEAIEKSLRGFSVTTLDWKKLDLCPFTLSRANISKLEEIHLYWSGRNPVLYGWSDREEGLPKITTLRKVFIHQIERNESLERIGMYIANFKTRMSDYHIVYEDLTSARTRSGFSEVGINASVLPPGKSEGPTPHQWLKCMEAFAHKFRNIQGLTDRQEDYNLNPVRIALIDDGCELCGENLRGASFNEYRTREKEWRVSPYWQSASGHGTLMERLIRRICPSADIYVIRLKTFDTTDSRKIQIDPQSAIDAIRHAVAVGVHMISMSWTIKPPEDLVIRGGFEDAIREAELQNILMFCSASDQGKFPDESYPYSASIQHIFRIGASDAMGMTSNFVDESKVDFIFPGEDVTIDKMRSDDIHDEGSQSFKAMAYTGSSVATALAAGLAALVFECVRLGVLYSLEQRKLQVPLVASDLKNLRTKNRMTAALGRIGKNTGRNDKYINVWETFEEGTASLDRADSRDEQMAAVAELARVKLLSKIQ